MRGALVLTAALAVLVAAAPANAVQLSVQTYEYDPFPPCTDECFIAPPEDLSHGIPVPAQVSKIVAAASDTLDTATRRNLSQTGTGQLLPSASLGSLNIALECTATATPNPLATGIEQCFLLGANGAHYEALNEGAKPGPADAIVYAQLTVPTQRYRVCVQSQAFFQDNALLKAPVVCSG